MSLKYVLSFKNIAPLHSGDETITTGMEKTTHGRTISMDYQLTEQQQALKKEFESFFSHEMRNALPRY